jgi:hypothetical protein
MLIRHWRPQLQKRGCPVDGGGMRDDSVGKTLSMNFLKAGMNTCQLRQ